jgi:hypothetical protein
VRGGLGFKTLLLALAPSDLTTAAIRHADELASQLVSAHNLPLTNSISPRERTLFSPALPLIFRL